MILLLDRSYGTDSMESKFKNTCKKWMKFIVNYLNHRYGPVVGLQRFGDSLVWDMGSGLCYGLSNLHTVVMQFSTWRYAGGPPQLSPKLLKSSHPFIAEYFYFFFLCSYDFLFCTLSSFHARWNCNHLGPATPFEKEC